MVSAALEAMHTHLLAPLAVEDAPRSLNEALDSYRLARTRMAAHFGQPVTSPAEAAVVARLRRAGDV